VFKEPIVAFGFGVDPTVDLEGSFPSFRHRDIMKQGEQELPTCEVSKFHFGEAQGHNLRSHGVMKGHCAEDQSAQVVTKKNPCKPRGVNFDWKGL
jgi:hypothetical protein